MILFSYASFVLMGLIVGLVGGGGAILTLPILVNLFHIDTVLATSYSLILVGTTALLGALMKLKSEDIVWRSVVRFGIPSIIATYFARHTLLPMMPMTVFGYDRGDLLLWGFIIIMFAAGWSMLQKKKASWQIHVSQKIRKILPLIEGLIVGSVTGLIGAGGGFLIIPALTLLERLSMRQAVASSLVIIALKSLIGVLGDIGNTSIIYDTPFLLNALFLSSTGLLIGVRVARYVNSEHLSQGFGVAILLLGLMMSIQQIFLAP